MSSEIHRPTDTLAMERGPRAFLLVGMAASALVCMPLAPTGALFGVDIGLLLLGALATGCGAALQPRSPAALGVAALAGVLTSFGFSRVGWDSASLLLAVLSAVATAAALIQLLPRSWQRAAVSMLILLHFGGIVTAVCSAPPSSWTFQQLWNYFYRPYLQFMYLNNAYHFYAPEPGPAPIMWFCVEYERDPDGTKNWRWVKVPAFDDEGRPIRPDGSRLWPNVEYTRRLSIAESISTPGTPMGNLMEMYARRVTAGAKRGIPVDQNMPLQLQYRPPAPMSLLWLGSYVRYISRTYKHPEKPELAVIGVKVYRAIHNLIMPGQILKNTSPNDVTLYTPFYYGEYDKDGKMKTETDTTLTEPGVMPDPFLFWEIPILREPGEGSSQRDEEQPGPVKNYVYVHANVPDQGDLP